MTPSASAPKGDVDVENIMRIVMGALATAGIIRADAGAPIAGPSQRSRGPVRAGAPLPPSAAAVSEAAGGQGGKKRKKRKKKKGKKKGEGAPPAQSGPSPPQTGRGPGPSAQGGQTTLDRPDSLQGDTWSSVVKRGGRKVGMGQGGGRNPPPTPKAPQMGPGARGKERVVPPRGPRGAAVTITCPEGKYAQVVTEAREKIDLKELGISGIRTRRAITGALVLEIPGQEGASKAEALSKKLEGLFAGREGVRISRPVRRSELRIKDLDDSVTARDIRGAVAEAGMCKEEEVQVGPMRKGPNNMGTSWVRCPLAAARKVAAGGRLTVGWTAARVEALAQRPLQCFRCMKEGHVRANCPSGVDRSGLCYRCGSPEHRAGVCTRDARCTVCADAGLPSTHMLGGRACKGVRAGPKKAGVQPTGARKEPGRGTPATEAPREGGRPPQLRDKGRRRAGLCPWRWRAWRRPEPPKWPLESSRPI